VRVPEPVLQPVAYEPVALGWKQGFNPGTPDTLTPSLSRGERGNHTEIRPLRMPSVTASTRLVTSSLR